MNRLRPGDADLSVFRVELTFTNDDVCAVCGKVFIAPGSPLRPSSPPDGLHQTPFPSVQPEGR